MAAKHVIVDAERHLGYATFQCPSAPALRFKIYQTVDRCPVCGDWKPLDERKVIHGKS
jgi:hypothetical protein